MKAIKNVGVARHFIIVSILGVLMSLYCVNKCKATTHSKRSVLKDPVISSMTWEGGEDTDRYLRGDNSGCPVNCEQNENCPGNCPTNCVINCLGNC